MTPEQEQKLNKLIEDVKVLNDDLMLSSKVIETVYSRKTDVVDYSQLSTGIEKSTSIGVGGGTVTGFDFPDKWMIIKYNGQLLRVPAYDESRFT